MSRSSGVFHLQVDRSLWYNVTKEDIVLLSARWEVWEWPTLLDEVIEKFVPGDVRDRIKTGLHVPSLGHVDLWLWTNTTGTITRHVGYFWQARQNSRQPNLQSLLVTNGDRCSVEALPRGHTRRCPPSRRGVDPSSCTSPVQHVKHRCGILMCPLSPH